VFCGTACRLRHNVLKTGVRMICLAYSRISLRDICDKLHLESVEDTEYIVAKVRGTCFICASQPCIGLSGAHTL
jgi:hypothetical protein